jgi:hypothetical protein
MTPKTNGPRALPGAPRADLGCPEQQFHSASGIRPKSLSPEHRCTTSRALRRFGWQSERDDARSFIKVVRPQNVGRWTIQQVSNETVASMETLLFPLRCEGAIQ